MQNAECRKTLRVLDYTGFARGGSFINLSPQDFLVFHDPRSPVPGTRPLTPDPYHRFFLIRSALIRLLFRKECIL